MKKAILVKVFYESEEAVRILGTDYCIKKSKVTEQDWNTYMNIIQNQNTIDNTELSV